MDGWQDNVLPEASKNRPKMGTGILAGIQLRNVIVIGDSTPVWNHDVASNSRTSVQVLAGKAYAGEAIDYDYLARCFSLWDARLANWLAGQKTRKKPLSYATLAAYFKVAAQKHGKCTILLYECEQVLARHGAEALLQFIEQTREYVWYVLIGGDSLNGLEIPGHMRPRRIDTADFTLTLREIQIYFSASNILLTKQQYQRLHQLMGGWTLAAYMVNNHLKRGEALREIDIDTAITEVFGELDALVANGMAQQERYTATLLSEFDTFAYELALACCPYNEKTIRGALEKTPGIRFAQNGASLAMHPLIRAYWQTKKHEVPKKLRDGCKSRAAKWYAASKDYMAALVCAIDAGDYTLARGTLQSMKTQQYYRRVDEITKVLECIDGKHLKAYPMLWAYKVTLYFITMDLAKGKMEKAALEKHLATHGETPDARKAKGEMLLLTAFMHIAEPCSVAYFAEAAGYLEGGSEICDAYLNDTIYNGTLIPYEGNKKHTLLDTCRIIGQAAPNRYQCTGNWARGHEHLCYAEYGYLTGNPRQLTDNANRALTDATAYQQWYVAKAANLMLLLQYSKMGLVGEAIDTWHAVHALARLKEGGSRAIEDIADAQVLFTTRQLYLLPEWIRDADAFRRRAKSYQPGHEYYLRGYYLLCKGQLQNALRLVCEAMGRTRFTDEWITQLHLMALKMIICMAMDEWTEAGVLLNEYYERTASEGLTMPLMEFGRDTAQLMEYFLHEEKAQPNKRLPPAGWMEAVKQGAAKRQDGSDAFFAGYYLWLQEAHGTSLSGNEYIVLQLLCLGYTYDGIRKELGIGKNYIHSVMRRVCKKLDVASEEEAVAYGRAVSIQDHTSRLSKHL